MNKENKIPAPVRSLLEAARYAPSADNSQPWRFSWDGENLIAAYDTKRVLGKTFGPESHATLLAMGALRENIFQMGNHLDIEIDWLAEEKDPHSTRFVHARLKSLPNKNRLEGHNHPVFQRHTNRLPYRSVPLADEILTLVAPMSQGQCRVAVITEKQTIEQVAEWVRIASEARFQARDLHELLALSLKFTAEQALQGDGLDVRTLGLPPGGKSFLRLIRDWDRLAFLNRFGLYKLLARQEGKLILKAPALIAVVGLNDRADALDAGRLLERVWISLNSQGIAVQPYYVVADQLRRLEAAKLMPNAVAGITRLKTQMGTLLKSGTLHMLLRIGYPGQEPIRSQRLPFDGLLDVSQSL